MNKKKSHLVSGETEVKTRQIVGNIRRNIDYGVELHKRLESASDELNISSQALVKVVLQDWLDRHELAKRSMLLKTGTA
jgi:hypothetical protein